MTARGKVKQLEEELASVELGLQILCDTFTKDTNIAVSFAIQALEGEKNRRKQELG